MTREETGQHGKVTDILCWTVVHSTEDERKVAEALEHVTGPGAQVETRKAETHFHQSMKVITARLKGRRSLEMLLSVLGPEDFKELIRTEEKRIDENGVFHFRLDKQSCLTGKAILSSRLDPQQRKENDSIDVEVHSVTYPGSRKNAVKLINDLLHELDALRQG